MFSSGTEDTGGSAVKWFILQPPVSQRWRVWQNLLLIFCQTDKLPLQGRLASQSGAQECIALNCFCYLLPCWLMAEKTHGDFCFGFLSFTTPYEFFRITVAEFFDVATWGYCMFALLYGFNFSGRLQWVSMQITRAGLLQEPFSVMRKCSHQGLPLQAEDNSFACQYLNVYQVF